MLLQKQNKIEDPNTSTCNFSHLIFDKDVSDISQRKEIIFNKWCKLDACKRMNYIHVFIILHKN